MVPLISSLVVPQSMASLEIFSIAPFNSEGVPEGGYVLDFVPGKTYLLRVINAGLFSEFYLKIAGHNFTVVAADANYVSPYTTDVIAIAPGETVDALVVANATPGRYYIVALPNQAPGPDTQTPEFTTRGMVQYRVNHSSITNGAAALRSRRGVKQEENDIGPSGDVAHNFKKISQHLFFFTGNLV